MRRIKKSIGINLIGSERLRGLQKKDLQNCKSSILKWALTDSNRRPSACKADALNQLS